jgi:hypothetical protein
MRCMVWILNEGGIKAYRKISLNPDFLSYFDQIAEPTRKTIISQGSAVSNFPVDANCLSSLARQPNCLA